MSVQQLTGTFGESHKAIDTWHRVELPDRSSSYNPYSDKEPSAPTSPELASPGLESVFKEEPLTEKELYADPSPEYDDARHQAPLKEKKRKLNCIIAIVALIVIVLGVGVGVGLGVGLRKYNTQLLKIRGQLADTRAVKIEQFQFILK